MRYLLALLVLVACVPLLFAAADAKPDTKAAEQAVTTLENEWIAAVKANDDKTVEAILSDDFTMVTPVGKVNNKEELIGVVRDKSLKLTSGKVEDLSVRVYGDTAVVVGTMIIAGTNGDADLSGSYRFTSTVVKHNGKWQKVAEQFSPIHE